MRLSKEERNILRFIRQKGGFIKSSHPCITSQATSSLLEKGILEAKAAYSYEVIGSYLPQDYYCISLSDCGRRLLQEHPELLRENAFLAFLSRSWSIIQEYRTTALYALILIFFAILIIVHEYG